MDQDAFILQVLKEPVYLERVVGLDKSKMEVNDADFEWEDEDI